MTRPALLLAALCLLAAALSSCDRRIESGRRQDIDFTWTRVADCPLPRFEAMGGAGGVRLLVLGGFTSAGLSVTSQVDLYDPQLDTWTRRSDLPGAQTHVGTAAVGTTVYLTGGFVGPFSSWVSTAAVWVYDVDNDIYTQQP